MLTVTPRQIILNADGYKPNERIIIKQGCINTIPYEAVINDRGGILTIPNGVIAKIRMLKPDKNQVLNDLSDPVDNKVLFTISEQMQAYPGTGKAELILLEGSNVLTTVTFDIEIQPNVHDDSQIESTPEYTTIINMLDRVESAEEGLDSKLDKTGDTKDNTTTFLEAETDTDIASGETHSTIFGKILKSIKTMKTALTDKIDKASIINNDTTGGANKVASAQVVKVHGEEIDAINNNLVVYKMTLITTTDLASIQNAYNNRSANYAAQTYYRFTISHNVLYNPLGGGQWYVEGFKATSDYEWQTAKIYTTTGISTYVRSKMAGVWREWVAK